MTDLCSSPRSNSGSSGMPKDDWSVIAEIFESSNWDPTNNNSGQTVAGTIPSLTPFFESPSSVFTTLPPGFTPTSIPSGLTPPSQGFSNQQLYGKRAHLSDPPTNGMFLPKGLEKGSRLRTIFLEKQKKLLDLHKDGNSNSVEFSPLPIQKPHWSPSVPSLCTKNPSPRSPKIGFLPFGQFSTSGSSASEVESHDRPVESAAEVKEPSLQFEAPSVEEAAPPVRLLANIGGAKKKKTDRGKEKRKKEEFPYTAALPFSAQTKSRGCLENGIPTGLRESGLEQKEEDGITEADLVSDLKLGERALRRMTVECDVMVKLCFKNKHPCIDEMEKLLNNLKDLNRDLKRQSGIYHEVIKYKTKAQQLSDTKCIQWISIRNQTLREAISFMKNANRIYLMNGSNINGVMALKILQACRYLVFGEDAKMVQNLCVEPANPIKMCNVERVVNDLEEVAGNKPWFTGFPAFASP